jgi:hypothetical protein
VTERVDDEEYQDEACPLRDMARRIGDMLNR